jgi:hypothetical protein
MNHKNPVIQESLRVALSTLILLALMFGVFFVVDAFSITVLYSGFTGWFLSIANFFFMCVAIVNNTSVTETNVQKAAAAIRTSYMLRSVALLVLLIVLLKSGKFDPAATLIPLLFIKPAVMIDNALFKTRNSQ